TDINNKNNASNQQKTHKVIKGDCLWDIAQKYYGKGSLYTKIKEANKSKYPKGNQQCYLHFMGVDNSMIKLICQKASGEKLDITNLLINITWSGDYKSCARKLEFSLISSTSDINIPKVDIPL